MTKVIEVLEGQHKTITDLFGQVSDPSADRPAVLHAILREMAAHVASERATIEPVAKERDLGDDLIGALTADYEALESLMVRIERRKFNSPDVPNLVNELKDAYEAHTARCRDHLFPGLSSALSADEQEQLGEKASNADEVVVTHPHPHLLSTGKLGSRLLAFVSRFDRLRDRAHPTRPNSPKESDPSMGGAT